MDILGSIMEKIVNHNLLKKDFIYHDIINDKKYNFDDLSDRICYFKTYLLDGLKIKAGDRIGFGLVDINFDYFALFFACIELGLPIIVLDWDTKFSDESLRVKEILPINYYFYNLNLNSNAEFYSKKAEKLIDVRDVKVEKNDNYKNYFLAKPDDIIMICTSSGTTNTPRKIVHTHRFFYDLVIRNTFLFRKSNSAIHTRNLHHGSSMATYFLPSLLACSNHYSKLCFAGLVKNSEQELLNLYQWIRDYNIENIQFPYPEITHKFLSEAVKTNQTFHNLRIFTLTYIMKDWINFVKSLKIYKVYSIFGASEVSGPILLSSIDKKTTDDFDPRIYQIIDHFYQLQFITSTPHEKKLQIKYKDEFNITLDDRFKKVSNGIKHIGRADIIKINDVVVELEFLKNLPSDINKEVQIVWDHLNSKIYLAIWESEPNKNISEMLNLVNEKIYEKYGSDFLLIKENNVKILNKLSFISSIKLDMELLREEFRKNDNKDNL